MRASKRSAKQVGSFEIRVSQVDPIEIRSIQTCLDEASAGKIGFRQVGIAQVGAREIGASEVGALEISLHQQGSGQAHAAQIGPHQPLAHLGKDLARYLVLDLKRGNRLELFHLPRLRGGTLALLTGYSRADLITLNIKDYAKSCRPAKPLIKKDLRPK